MTSTRVESYGLCLETIGGSPELFYMGGQVKLIYTIIGGCFPSNGDEPTSMGS